MQALVCRYPVRFVLGLIEVAADFDHGGAEGGHRRILIRRVAVWHIYGCGDAGTCGGKGNGLPMVAARR